MYSDKFAADPVTKHITALLSHLDGVQATDLDELSDLIREARKNAGEEGTFLVLTDLLALIEWKDEAIVRNTQYESMFEAIQSVRRLCAEKYDSALDGLDILETINCTVNNIDSVA